MFITNTLTYPNIKIAGSESPYPAAFVNNCVSRSFFSVNPCCNRSAVNTCPPNKVTPLNFPLTLPTFIFVNVCRHTLFRIPRIPSSALPLSNNYILEVDLVKLV